MTQATAILGLLAQTSMHAGAGAAVGAVDLPIQREGHNGWPCVFGSAMKGALRAKAEGRLDPDTVITVFGPETTEASEHAGALAVGDARLLLLPVRSLTSSFKWVTCHEALERLKRDIDLLGLTDTALQFDAPRAQDTSDACTAKVHAGADGLFLEEYRFTSTADPAGLAATITALAALMQRTDAHTELESRLVIISDDIFSFLVHHATPVAAHIAIESASKTVKDGALWYEETLPPETLLYAPLVAHKSRKKDGAEATAIRQAVVNTLFMDGSRDDPWLQIGGNETVGMGWCAVKAVCSGGPS